MTPGKRFEQKIALSLSMLDGVSMRIEDGGRYAHNRQLADFLYWPNRPLTYAIECKATQGTSFQLSRLGFDVSGGQIDRLLNFYNQPAGRYAFIAFEFYGKSYRTDRRCYLVDAKKFYYKVKSRTVKENEIANLGRLCPIKKYEINGIVKNGYDIASVLYA